ncbi:MAG: OmpH family outer membrane protein, partial [Planctomycetaceae bacterium]|nr:OmpH family outer membrane protein [Planctomycetaceae bacterium]
ATIQENHKKFQDNLEKLAAKYDAIFEREAKERQKAYEEQQKTYAEHKKAYEERQKAYEEQKKAEEAERQKAYEEQQKAYAERMKKYDEDINRTTLSVNRLTENMGGISNRFGEMVEHLVAPNIADRFNELGYEFKGISRGGIEIRENGQVVAEVDILLENGKTVTVVEVKAKPTKHDIRRHFKRMQIVRRWYCEQYVNTNKEFIGAVAGAIFPDHVKQFAIETGFYVIAQTGDTVKIDVPKNFKPRIF